MRFTEKFVYIHFPRCAGRFLSDWLENEIVGVRRPREFIDVSNIWAYHIPIRFLWDSELSSYEEYQDKFKWGLIRNPFDWYVSMWDMDRWARSESPILLKFDIFFFKEWIKNYAGRMAELHKELFCLKNGKFVMDEIIKFENFKEDMRKLFAKLKIDIKEESWKKLDVDPLETAYGKFTTIKRDDEWDEDNRKLYTKELVKLIVEKDKIIFERYGYATKYL